MKFVPSDELLSGDCGDIWNPVVSFIIDEDMTKEAKYSLEIRLAYVPHDIVRVIYSYQYRKDILLIGRYI